MWPTALPMPAHPSPPTPSPAHARGTWTLGSGTRLFSAALMWPIAAPLVTTGLPTGPSLAGWGQDPRHPEPTCESQAALCFAFTFPCETPETLALLFQHWRTQAHEPRGRLAPWSGAGLLPSAQGWGWLRWALRTADSEVHYSKALPLRVWSLSRRLGHRLRAC